MKLLFVSQTPLAGMPQRTMKVCNMFLVEQKGWARSLVYNKKYYGERTYENDLEVNTPEAEQALEECDCVILPAYMGKEHARGKPFTRHFSTEPHRWITDRPDPLYSTVIAQYQARFAKHLDVLPNCLPIDDEMYRPIEKQKDKVNIVYTPTSRQEDGWSNKGYVETMLAFRRLLADETVREKVNIYLLENKPHEVVMAARRHAHIVIDECATGSYHSSTLEGLSCGAAVLSYIDKDTQQALNRLFGEEKHLPVINSRLGEMYRHLRMLVMNPVLLNSMMRGNRQWMEKNYSERWQAERWISWHRAFLRNIGTPLTN